DEFRVRLSASAKVNAFEVRMKLGDILLVDNRRVLHGRRAIAEGSPRRLHRIWISKWSPGEVAGTPAVGRPREAVVA
ncbi:MAG: TauD/TfdA family dioxygenase, partial [Rhodoglobus sp.]